MPWVFSEISSICFAVPYISLNPLEALVIQLIHVWWFSSNQMKFHSMPEQIDIQQQTQCDSHEDFWSIFSSYLSSLFILCSTNSKHFSLPKHWLLWSHSSKTGVLWLESLLVSQSTIRLQAENLGNHDAYLVHFLFSWIKALGYLFPISEKSSFLYFK